MQVPGTAGRVVRLPAGGEQWVQAHRRHARLLRHSSVAAEAFEVAAAVTASWWWQAWPREHVWPSRLRSLGSGRMDTEVWRVLARELVTYPETVALATLLADDGFRQCLIADARGHVPFRLADLPVLLSAVERCVGRPWYGEQLADETSGPLFAWAYQCVRPPRRTRHGEQAMWAVAPAHRLRPLVDELATRISAGAGEQKVEGKRLRGLNRQSDESFTAGLAHAGQYVREHGNLAVQKDTMVGSFRLGEWLHNVQTRAWALSPDRVRALTVLDPWWNVPWSVQWQRSYYRARDHAAVDGPPDAAAGFAGTAVLNGEWLYLQCTQYDALHLEQQRLLADIGVTAEAARTARPRRASMRARFETGLAHARAYATEHGHLAVSGKRAVHEGYPLGAWLGAQRSKAHRAARPTERSQGLRRADLRQHQHALRAARRRLHRPPRPRARRGSSGRSPVHRGPVAGAAGRMDHRMLAAPPPRRAAPPSPAQEGAGPERDVGRAPGRVRIRAAASDRSRLRGTAAGALASRHRPRHPHQPPHLRPHSAERAPRTALTHRRGRQVGSPPQPARRTPDLYPAARRAAARDPVDPPRPRPRPDERDHLAPHPRSPQPARGPRGARSRPRGGRRPGPAPQPPPARQPGGCHPVGDTAGSASRRGRRGQSRRCRRPHP
ncbi:Helicase associated domain protein [Streptomyces sp. KM273126]|nr:Helicase associated domain protein [Streptomyces sp. KM273126]